MKTVKTNPVLISIVSKAFIKASCNEIKNFISDQIGLKISRPVVDTLTINLSVFNREENVKAFKLTQPT